MNYSPEKFTAASIGEKFKRACFDLEQLLASIEDEKAIILRESLDSGIKDYNQQGSLNIAFVGQYSAGKSTIISALTGRRDIRIDTDIATDKTTDYSWNGVRVVDTPGLFTDRADHDEITYSAIDKADLLVFCLTYMLFDNITVENFKKLAYDKGYGWKMLLVVNKMSAEAGEETAKINSYQKSLTDALAPHGLSDFPVCFIDAKDFCEGVDEDDDFLQDISRFDTFTTALNTFVSQRASYSKLDTPVRIVLSVVDDTEKLLVPHDTEDAAYLEILRQLSRRIEQERDRLRTKVKSIQLKVASAILNEGNILAQAVGNEIFADLNAHSEINVRQHYEESERSLQRVLEQAIASIRIEIESELSKDLPQAFIARLNANHKAGEYDDNSTETAVNSLKAIAKKVDVEFINKAAEFGAGLTNYAARGGILRTAGDGALRSLDVVGGDLHSTVKSVGGMIGYKFKPWEAVGIAKNLGNAARLLGPVAAVATVAVQAYSVHKENERNQAILSIRQDIQKYFQDMSVNLKFQMEEQLQAFEQHVYDDIQSTIDNERQEREFTISTASSNYKVLTAIRHNLNSALADIKTLAMPLNKREL
ncbi:MAG: GTPase [Phormidesmis priestleyi]|uniref:GTPase n=1 Tax=Phormidesmis priestleyi TaxID=268141 RepID=A0A2W4XDW9_9CYAN|nr:MAG: GTPase [Phormidesmis priestleyi]